LNKKKNSGEGERRITGKIAWILPQFDCNFSGIIL